MALKNLQIGLFWQNLGPMATRPLKQHNIYMLALCSDKYGPQKTCKLDNLAKLETHDQFWNEHWIGIQI